MHYRSLLLTVVLYVLSQAGLVSQQSSYFIPRELQRAYHNKTRNAMGLPGQEYWQNRADYTINAEIDPIKSEVKGDVSIAYVNNSTDTLKRLVFNIYQDIFKKGNSRDWDIGTEDLHDGTMINELIVEGNSIDLINRQSVSRQGTKLIVRLSQPILPQSKADIKVNWSVKLPSLRTVRMGKYSDSIAFVAYWYPQIAVYDDIDGWDMISYNGSVEFYNEFGDFDVSITAPAGWALWATGRLQNPEEVYHNNIQKKYQQALNSEAVVRIITEQDYQSQKVFQSKNKMVWKFFAKDVPDFSFAMGQGMLWDASTLEVDAKNNQSVFIASVYPPSSVEYKNVADFSRQSIEYMSFIMPGVAFPYPTMTTFSNGKRNGGMETPMMANNGNPTEESDLFGLTFHEIAHSYMPFMMGTNEKKYAWMDEGWASLWPSKLVDSLYPQHQYLKRTVESFEAAAGKEMDIPPMVPNHLMATNYPSLRLGSYTRPAMAYHFLEDALGSEKFQQVLRFYMQTWKGKHPLPLDFIKIFEMVADQDLSWFFSPWLYENAYPDLCIKKITDKGSVVVENRGGLPLPVVLKVKYTDQTEEVFEYSTAVWSSLLKSIIIELASDKHVQEITLGNEYIPDVNRKDNYMLVIDQTQSK